MQTTTADPASDESNQEAEHCLMKVLATLEVLAADPPHPPPPNYSASPMLKTMPTEHGPGQGQGICTRAQPEPESPCGEHMSREGTETWTFAGDDDAPPLITTPQSQTNARGGMNLLPLQNSRGMMFHSQVNQYPSSTPAELLHHHHHPPQYHVLGGTGFKPDCHPKHMSASAVRSYHTDLMNTQMLHAGCRRIPIHFNLQNSTETHQHAATLDSLVRLRQNAHQTHSIIPPHQATHDRELGVQKVIHLSAQNAPGVAEVDSLAPTLELFIGQLPYHFDLLSVVYMVNQVIASIFVAPLGEVEDGSLLPELNVVTRIKQGPKPTCAFVEVVQPYAKILLRQSKRILCDQDGVWVATPQRTQSWGVKPTAESAALFSDLLRPHGLGGPNSKHLGGGGHCVLASDVARLENNNLLHFSVSPAAVQALDDTTAERSLCQVKGIPHQAVVMQPATVRGTRQQQMAHSRRAQQQAMQHQHRFQGQYSQEFECSEIAHERNFVAPPVFAHNTMGTGNPKQNSETDHLTLRNQQSGRSVHRSTHMNPMLMSNLDSLKWLQPHQSHLALVSVENLSKVLLNRAPATAMSICPCGSTHLVTGVPLACLCVMCSRWLAKGAVVRRCPLCEEQILCPLCVATIDVPLCFAQKSETQINNSDLPPPQMHLKVPRTVSSTCQSTELDSMKKPLQQFVAVSGSLWE